ncbi:MAG TPA: hypothetical protein VM554_00030 [Acidisarcina sp.]|nr:hypothetical protein [Acidisarcina sp.]
MQATNWDPSHHLIAAIIKQQPYDTIRDYTPNLRWAIKSLVDDAGVPALSLCLDFIEQMKKCPTSIADLREFGTARSEYGNRWILIVENLSLVETGDPDGVADAEVLTVNMINQGRVSYFEKTFQHGINIATGRVPDEKKGGDAPRGVVDAMAFVRKRAAEDPITPGFRGIEGDIIEASEEISDNLDAILRREQGDRFLTGLPSIDTRMVIGPKNLRWIGVLGYTGSGKSTFCKSLMVHFAVQGARVLFVPCEETPEKAMATMIWTYAAYIDPRVDPWVLDLPSLNDWETQPDTISAEGVLAKDTLFDRFRHAMAGSIECTHAETLDDVLEHYHTHRTRKRYNVICIDYVALMGVEFKNTSEEVAAHSRDFKRLQAFANHEEVVCVTPLQSNRAGFSAADKDEDDQLWGCYRDCNAVDTFSAASQGMDVVLGVWFRGPLKETNTMRISLPKPPRSGLGFEFFDVHVDPTSRCVRELTPEQAADVRDIQMGINPYESPEEVAKCL